MYKITKKIRLIELFGGIGCQAKAIENLDAKGLLPNGYELYKLVEFDKYCIASYNAIHGTNFPVLDICNIHASDLAIRERERFEYILTYSFPCQDISGAGKMRGFDRNSNTRSSLLWQVERLLVECGTELPQILVMENVPLIISKNNIDNFNEWCNFLKSKGYSNHYKLLNSKDYGIPQNRNRCFMVSILGDYDYHFPEPFELKLRLENMLEDDVDEKYFLDEEKLDNIKNTSFEQGKLDNRLPTETAGGTL